jgi:hypothetical protein
LQQGRLTDAGITAQKHYSAWNQTTTEHPVEFAKSCAVPLFDVIRQLIEPLGPCAGARYRGRCRERRLRESIPTQTIGALPCPFDAVGAAFSADVRLLCLCHGYLALEVLVMQIDGTRQT